MDYAVEFAEGRIAYEDAVTAVVRERSKFLNEATSGRGANPTATAKRRLSAYKQADALHKQLKKIWHMRSTPHEFEPTLGSHKLQSSYKGTARYVTPERFDASRISHTKLTADEKFARENVELLNLDFKMARIAALGLLSVEGE